MAGSVSGKAHFTSVLIDKRASNAGKRYTWEKNIMAARWPIAVTHKGFPKGFLVHIIRVTEIFL